MSDDKFDAIVVGAGVAGSVAALVMARAVRALPVALPHRSRREPGWMSW